MMDRTFKYVDKDRLLPWIVSEISKLETKIENTSNGSVCMCERCQILALEHLMKHVIDGVFDWQPAE